MQHTRGNSCQTAQCRGMIQVTIQRGESLSAHCVQTAGIACQCENSNTTLRPARSLQQSCGTLPHIATTDDEHTFTAKARR